jgi:lysophospholipase L1-like esterase
MKMMKRLFVVALLFITVSSYAQPFIEEIQAFRHEDSVHAPEKKVNLFVGSSSLRMWTDINSYFPKHKIINRGFGGSALPDVIRYADDIIFKYKPKQILIYCGENDLAASDTVSAETVVQRFKTLFGMIRSHWKKMPVVFISIKPSPSRANLMPKIEAANQMIRDFLATQKKTKYVDVYSLMLVNGQPRPDIFREDNLHMNAKGYEIWKKAIKPVLK